MSESTNEETFVEEGGVTGPLGQDDDGPGDYPDDDPNDVPQDTGVEFDPNDTEFPGVAQDEDPEDSEDDPDASQAAPDPDKVEG